MRLSILSKIFGGFCLIIILLAVLFLSFTFSLIKDFHLDSLAVNLENLGRALETKIISDLESARYEELDAFVKDFGQRIKTRITIVDKQGVVLADSDEDPKLMNNHRFRPEISQAFDGEVGRSIRFSNTVKEDMLYVGLPVKRGDEISEVIRVSLYDKDIRQLRTDLRSRILLLIFIMISISLGGALLVSRSISKPVKKLRNAFQEVASGDFDTRVLLNNRDELKDLAMSFNDMTEQIKHLFTELSQKKDELSSILYSISEGLLAIDSNDRIVLSNESIKRFIPGDKIDGKYYWEVIRDPHFGNMIQRLKKEGGNLSEELELNDRIFLCSAIHLDPREEIVVTLHDLTQRKELEKIKKDFIVNASHELRTPLTAIKGFVETLEEKLEAENRDHLEIIKKNTDRLINIVNDLLLLSGLEEKDAKLEIELVDVPVLVESIAKIFQQKILEKKLDLQVQKSDNIPSIEGDPYKLEQMFINLIDNAVKYTERGNIQIEFGKAGEKLLITIRDTGIGIPAEHLPRIFERFFVTDKARARKLGGTGLGLSIVKHIILLHRGEVTVESTPGKGTAVVIAIPLHH
jgi:two-component system phosphate regulon sensor histidine kinase PhoR